MEESVMPDPQFLFSFLTLKLSATGIVAIVLANPDPDCNRLANIPWVIRLTRNAGTVHRKYQYKRFSVSYVKITKQDGEIMYYL
jgi:hypothetical protein